MSLFILCALFFKFGFLCIGGGYMLIPFLVSDLVYERQLLTLEDFGNIFGIAQVTPGPVGINTATFVGFSQQGIVGAILASIALILPGLMMMTVIIHCFQRFRNNWIVKGIFKGIRPASLGLIFGAVLIFMEMSLVQGHIPLDYPFLWIKGVFNGTVPSLEFFTPRIGALLIFIIFLWVQLKTKIPLIWQLLVAGTLGSVLCSGIIL